MCKDVDAMGTICYVVPQVPDGHPCVGEFKDKLIMYPERSMSLFEQVKYYPFARSIVTENPWIIGTYPRERVRVWKDGQWEEPEMQTLGADVAKILWGIIGIHQTIPSCIYDGGDLVNKTVQKYTEEYKK